METLSLFVLGAFSSGKTQFIQSISEIEIVSTDRPRKDTDHDEVIPALDFGRLTIDADLVLYLFGQPGARRASTVIDAYREYYTQSLGCLVMVDSSVHFISDEVSLEFRAVLNSGVPCLVVANKQDRQFAVPPRQVRRELEIPDHIPVLPCIAKDESHVRRILIEFCKSLPQNDRVARLLQKLTTQAALDLDLGQFDTKPEIGWARLLIFSNGEKRFSEYIDGFEKSDFYSGKPFELQNNAVLYWQENGLSVKAFLRWNYYQRQGYVLFIEFEIPLTSEEIISIADFLQIADNPALVLIRGVKSIPDDFRQRLNLSPEIPILTCDTVDKDVMKQVILSLYKLNPHDDTLKRLAAKLST